MGLISLASRAIRPASRLLHHQNTNFFLRTIVSKPELQSPETAAVSQPEPPKPELPPRNPVGGARVHFSNPDEAIEEFVDGFSVKIPKGMRSPELIFRGFVTIHACLLLETVGCVLLRSRSLLSLWRLVPCLHFQVIRTGMWVDSL